MLAGSVGSLRIEVSRTGRTYCRILASSAAAGGGVDVDPCGAETVSSWTRRRLGGGGPCRSSRPFSSPFIRQKGRVVVSSSLVRSMISVFWGIQRGLEDVPSGASSVVAVGIDDTEDDAPCRWPLGASSIVANRLAPKRLSYRQVGSGSVLVHELKRDPILFRNGYIV